MPDRFDVFISSTAKDLRKYRERVKEAVIRQGAYPIAMEEFDATTRNALQLCYDEVQKAEIFIGIYAYRYGFAPGPEMTYTTTDGTVRAGDGETSITAWEYLWAVERGIPILLYVVSEKDEEGEPLAWPKHPDFEDEEPNKTRLKAFKARLMGKHGVGQFYSPDNLQAQVVSALSKEIETLKKTTTVILDEGRWEAGIQFDDFKLIAPIGEGGNGEVWRAEQALPESGAARTVAIKVLKASVSDDPVRVERFRREISTIAMLEHPHIVKVYTWKQRAGQWYVVMPLLEGGTLRERVDGKVFSLEAALVWLEQIGRALDHAHARKLIHRDVKPENMLLGVDEDETLYLADFGLVFSEYTTERRTKDKQPVGTGRYMAPEQWRKKELTYRIDLYALAILAYELLTGHLPFQHDNDLDLGNAHCDRPLPEDARLPDEVLRILRKGAAKDPADRYETARAFLSDLRNWKVDPANIEPRIHDYLDWLTADIYEREYERFVELAGDEQSLRPALPAPRRRRFHTDDEDVFSRVSTMVGGDHVDAAERNSSFVQNVRERLLTLSRSVLIGEPGSGKSFMLRRLCVEYARRWLAAPESPEARIPVLIFLNEYNGGPFRDVVKAAMDTLAPYHDRLLREGRLVILCDALNEMPRKQGQLAELIRYLGITPHFVVSCRVADYRDDLGDLKPLEQVRLRDLELDGIHDLVQKRLPGPSGARLWHAMGGSDELTAFWKQVQAAGEGPRFWDAKTEWYSLKASLYPGAAWRLMHNNPARLMLLCRNPYMGDLLCRTYKESDGQLPGSRAALFGGFVSQMLRRERRQAEGRGEDFPADETIQAGLVALAKALQAAKRTVMSQEEILQAIPHPEAIALLRAALGAQILTSDGEGIRFAHQLLQEYFALRVLLEAMEAGSDPEPFFQAGEGWWDPGVWRETTVILGEHEGGAGGANRVARWLAPASPEVALEVVTRSAAGMGLEHVEPETRDALLRSARTKQSESDPRGRAAAYRVLGKLKADNRFGIALGQNGVPEIDWVKIPAGPFLMGSDNERDYLARGNEMSQRAVTLAGYSISRYPITYAQYEPFVNGDGYRNESYWTKAGWAWKAGWKWIREKTPPGYWNDPKWHISNHPVVGVTWYEAYAYCQWLSVKLGQEVRLPTEAEWERAARGTDGRIYPYEGMYDSMKGNTKDTGIGRMSAVGIFPDGASPEGVLDMSGNVRNWCQTQWAGKYQHPGVNAAEGTAERVMRGGSWGKGRGGTRSAFRLGLDPYVRDDLQGFRVVVASPIDTAH